MNSVWTWLKKWWWIVLGAIVLVLFFVLQGKNSEGGKVASLFTDVQKKIMDAEIEHVKAVAVEKGKILSTEKKIERINEEPDPAIRRKKVAEVLEDL